MVKSSLLYVLGRYGASAITVLSIAVLTRLATPADYGIYALVLSAAQTGYATLLQWLRLALNRFLPTYADRESFFFTQIAAGYLSVVAAVVVIGIVLELTTSDADIRFALVMGVPLFIAMGFAEVGLSLMQSQLRAGFYSLLSILRAVVSAVTGIALLMLGYGASGLVIGTMAGYAVCGMPVLWVHRSKIRLKEADRATVVRLARYGMPFALTSALVSVIALADRYIIAALLGTEAAGLYAAPYDLANRSLQVMMLAISLAGTPLIFRAYESGSMEDARPVLNRQFQLLAGTGIPVALALSLLSPAVSKLLLGPQFQASGAELMPWIVMATLIQGFETFYFSYAFALTQRALGLAGVLGVAAAFNIALNFGLIPIFGLPGAAAATLASACVAALGSAWLGRRHITLPIPWGDLGRIAAACVPLVALLWPFRNLAEPLVGFIAGCAGMAIYAAAAVMLDVGGVRTGLRLRRKAPETVL